MDMRMPVMDGFEATNLQALKPRSYCLGSALEEDRTVALSMGCDDFVRKPFG